MAIVVFCGTAITDVMLRRMESKDITEINEATKNKIKLINENFIKKLKNLALIFSILFAIIQFIDCRMHHAMNKNKAKIKADCIIVFKF
ncbi:MAG: hypothetical protein Q7J54_05065 [Candidatus Woesearchaeota archaeon]|nr:hypothetical protein [Candidatus Woesearchaeota archaeon]